MQGKRRVQARGTFGRPPAIPVAIHDDNERRLMEGAYSGSTDVVDYLRPLWSRKWVVLAIVAIATAATYAYFDHQPKEYGATARIYLSGSLADDPLADPTAVAAEPRDDRNVQNQASLLHTRTVAERVASDLKTNANPGALLSAVDIEPVQGSDIIRITAKAAAPNDAARLANGFAQAYVELKDARFKAQVRRDLAAAQQQRERATRRSDRNALDVQIRRLQLLQATGSGKEEQLDLAVPSDVPVTPKPKRNAAFAFALSLLFAAIAAYVLERVDRRIRRPDEVQELYLAPVLAEIPYAPKPSPVADGQVTVAEPLKEVFRTLAMNIAVESLERPVRTLLVTSAIGAEGKTTVVRNLAITFREAGMRVAVIDADLRHPALHTLLNVRREPGLTDVLADRRPLASVLQWVNVGTRGRDALSEVPSATAANGNGRVEDDGTLLALTSGPIPANPPAVLAAGRTRTLLHDLAARYDIVLVDCPPVLPVGDVLPLLLAVDAVLLVAGMHVATTDAAQRLGDQLRRVHNLRVLGVVVNGVPARALNRAYEHRGIPERT